MAFINLKKQATLPPRLIRNLIHDSHLFVSSDPYVSFLDFLQKHAAVRLCASVQAVHMEPIQVFWGRYTKGKGIDSQKLVYDRTKYSHVRRAMFGNYKGDHLGSPNLNLLQNHQGSIPASGIMFDYLMKKLTLKQQYFVFLCAGTSSTDRRIMVDQDSLVHIKSLPGQGCTLGDVRTGLVESASALKHFVKYLN